MTNYIIKFTIFMTFLETCIAAGTCSSTSINLGRDLAIKQFEKWDKNCTTLESFYEKTLKNDPTEKCLKRGFWFQARDLYENYSIKCNPDCKNVGKTLGKNIGIAFCDDKVFNVIVKTCNARDESICSDAFFDYVYENCNDKRVANEYQNYFKYLEYCNINLINILSD